MPKIELTYWLRAELTRRAEQEAPQEACGLISAPGGRTKGSRPGIGLWAAKNAAEAPETSFVIAPKDQTEILRQIWGRGEDLVGLYHSHPRSAPKPSQRDREIAAAIQSMRPDSAPLLTWVIVGLPPCSRGCKGTTDACCPECGDWGYVERFWVGELP